MKKITVVIPCYNEEQSIAGVIAGFRKADLRKRGYAIDFLVVDNNSDDTTADVARAAGAKVLYEPQQGKGNAIRAAFYNIDEKTDYVVMCDGDATYRGDEVLRLVELLESGFADVAVGSRLAGKIEWGAMTRLTRLGNWFFSLLTRYTYSTNSTDALSGYFAWKREVVTELRQHLRSDDFVIPLEMTIKMARMGWRIYSVPVTYTPGINAPHRRYARDGLRMLRSFVRLLTWRPPMQRIAFVSDTVWPYFKGGKEKRLHEISSRMVRAGRQVDLYTFKWWHGPDHIVNSSGVHLHALAKQRAIYKDGKRNLLPALTFSLACFKLFFRRFDVVDADSMPFFPLYPVRIVTWLKRKKMYATWHEVWGTEYWQEYMGSWQGRLAALVEDLAMHLPDAIISVSNHTSRRLREVGCKRPVLTVPLGVDMDIILTTPPHELQSDIIYAGRLISHKNVDLLIRAVKLVKRTKPDVRCLIVGDGPERARLERLVVELKLQHNVTFFNFLEQHTELLALMKSSKMFVLPSVREGFSLVVIEANACGIPVITTAHEHNAAKDLIIEGRNGYLADLNIKHLAAQMRMVLKASGALAPTKAVEEDFGMYRWKNAAAAVEQVLAKPQPVKEHAK